MAELVINKIIKITLAVAVLVVIVLGISFAVKNYVIPYFSGIGFDDDFEADPNSQFEKLLITEENKIGVLRQEGKNYYFIDNEVKTNIYLTKSSKGYDIFLEKFFGEASENNFIRFFQDFKVDNKIGIIDGTNNKLIINKEIIENNINYLEKLNGSYKRGNEIYMIKILENEG